MVAKSSGLSGGLWLTINSGFFLLALLIPHFAFAQAYKCCTATGAVIVTSEGCYGNSKLERIATSAPMTHERRRQAAEVTNRMLSQLDSIQAENHRYQKSLQQQAVSQAILDREASVAAEKKAALDRQKTCLDEASRLSGRAQTRMLSICNGTHYDEPEQPAPPNVGIKSPDPLPVIKNCMGNSCSDQFGNRYTEMAGKITNSKGQRCYQSGKVMYCN